MRTTTHKLIEDLQHEADENRRCIISDDKKQVRLLYRQRRLGTIDSPWPGMFVTLDAWQKIKPDERMRRIVRTLAVRHPSWVFCGLTAALMHGLQVHYDDLRPVHVVEHDPGHGKNSELVVRHVLPDRSEFSLVDGVLATTLERTVMDCLASLDFPRGLAIADSALRVSGKSRKHFIDYIKTHATGEVCSRALDAMAWADARAANGGESVARAVMIEQGFMVPDLQVMVPNALEGGVYYTDFQWTLPDGTRVAGELDGLDKYLDPNMTGGRSIARVMSDERRRESRLGASDLKVVRFSYEDVLDTERFVQLLMLYGIPRGKARLRGR